MGRGVLVGVQWGFFARSASREGLGDTVGSADCSCMLWGDGEMDVWSWFRNFRNHLVGRAGRWFLISLVGCAAWSWIFGISRNLLH